MRSPGPTRRALRALLRVLILVVLALLGGNGTLAASSSCCALPADALAGGDSSECCHPSAAVAEDKGGDEHCPCPLPCHPGCTGHGQRALAGAPNDFVPLPPGVRLEQPRQQELRPPGPEPGDILRVPKLRAA